MMPMSPQYDIIAFYSGSDVSNILKWFDRLYNYLTDQIGMLEAAINALKAAEDKDPTISKDLSYMDQHYEGSTPEEIAAEAESEKHPIWGAPPDILVFSGYHTRDYSSIPNPRRFLEQLLDQRVRMIEVVYGGRKKILGLEKSITFGGRPVIMIWESIWYIFGTRYLFSPQDAQEYFCLKGECSGQSYPYLWHDPYFDHIQGLSFGDVVVDQNDEPNKI